MFSDCSVFGERPATGTLPGGCRLGFLLLTDATAPSSSEPRVNSVMCGQGVALCVLACSNQGVQFKAEATFTCVGSSFRQSGGATLVVGSSVHTTSITFPLFLKVGEVQTRWSLELMLCGGLPVGGASSCVRLYFFIVLFHATCSEWRRRCRFSNTRRWSQSGGLAEAAT